MSDTPEPLEVQSPVRDPLKEMVVQPDVPPHVSPIVEKLVPQNMAPILEITGLFGSWNNPTLQHDLAGHPNWTADIVGGKTFLSGADPAWEWTPILPPRNEFEVHIVGVSGTAIENKITTTDNPFLHPFGNDYEFFIAPDKNYTPLLSPNNLATGLHVADGIIKAIGIAKDDYGLDVPGVLGVETDQDLVPTDYRAQDGDRVAVFGRWIVDDGHDNFESEIHPPLLLASAHVDSADSTQVKVISRPYLVSQQFNEGGLWNHLIAEIAKTIPPFPPVPIPASTRVEAHPRIYTTPFFGIQLMTFTVRPPSPRQSPADQLKVQYHFTARSSVTIQLINDAQNDEVKVAIVMNTAGYAPALLPNRHDLDVSLDDLDALQPGLGTKIKGALIGLALGGGGLGGLDPISSAVVAGILSQGVRTDRYDAPRAASTKDVNVVDINADQLGGGPHFDIDDGQPFPVYGFLTVAWERAKSVIPAHVVPSAVIVDPHSIT
jgi:hypothetical protein